MIADTLKQIAIEAGVHVSTVSRALSGKAGVSPSRREMIRALAKRHGYRPNPNAQALRSGNGTGLTVINPEGMTEITSLRGTRLVEIGRREFGLTRILVASCGDSPDHLLREALAQGCRAIVLNGIEGKLSAGTISILCQQGVPLCSLDRQLDGIDNVCLNRAAGAYQAARLLLLGGCRRPVFYSNASLDRPDDRLCGIIAAYKSLGLPSSEISLISFREASLRGGFECTENLLRSDSADGIFAYSDAVAIGALKALHDAGVGVPEEVKLIGFDNLPVTEYLPVSLTTVAHPAEEMAAAAITMLKQRLEDFSANLRTRIFETRLIVRESAPINKHALRDKIFDSSPA